jgi:type IV secretion system protein VirB9
VKPRDIGLTTSLVVTTDHRTYHLMLVSDEKEFMHAVRFVYDHEKPAQPASTPASSANPAPTPQQVAADPPPRRQQKSDGKRVAFVAADDTDDGYVVTGQADWKPVTVYSKGGKTYIEMPESVRHKEAPVLFEETRKGWFHHEKILVNYRVKGRWWRTPIVTRSPLSAATCLISPHVPAGLGPAAKYPRASAKLKIGDAGGSANTR